MNAPATSKIGLALSGGGSRAIAFHLGCLRALNQLGLLDRVSVALDCLRNGCSVPSNSS